MAQMAMGDTVGENVETALRCMERAKAAGADLIFFPEVQFSPFFPRYSGRDASRWRMTVDSPAVLALREQCRRLELWASPNLYLLEGEVCYDASLLIDHRGEIVGTSKMVHIAQARNFYEQEYYAPSQEGFRVWDTPFGRIGIVICFDRHVPESIRSCARQGAELVLVPTANLTEEPMELFAWEIQVQAFQNTVFVAMCNRVGSEGAVTFAGESLVAAPEGTLLLRADGAERLLTADIPLERVQAVREQRPWLAF